MLCSLRFDSGGSGQLVKLDGDRVSLTASRAAPPGSTLVAEYQAGHRMEIKVRGCRLTNAEPETFEIDGRILNLTRVDRERLARLLPANLKS